MAIFRAIRITYWQDKYVLALSPEQKFFYLYLMTNSKTKQCGVYEIPLSIANLETGYNNETIRKLLNKFQEDKKIIYDFETEEVIILNHFKYNAIDNINIYKCIVKEAKEIKSVSLYENFIQMFTIANTNDYDIEPLIRGLKGACNTLIRNKHKHKHNNKHNMVNENINIPFELFWDNYDKKVGDKNKLEVKWNSYSNVERIAIIEHLKKYIPATPDKKYRKNPQTYFNQKSWNDEIITDFRDANIMPVKSEADLQKEKYSKSMQGLKYLTDYLPVNDIDYSIETINKLKIPESPEAYHYNNLLEKQKKEIDIIMDKIKIAKGIKNE